MTVDKRAVAGIIAIAVLGAASGWWVAGVYYAWRAPPVPPMPALPGLGTIVFDAEVFADNGIPEATRRERLVAVAKFLDDQRPHDLRCAVRPPIDAARGILTVDGVDSGAFVVLGNVYLTAGREAGEGTLRVPGYETARVTWRAGEGGGIAACPAPVTLVAADAAVVVGLVRRADGTPMGGIAVTGCGASAVTDVDGAYYLEAADGSPCELTASGAAGPGAAVAIEPKLGAERVVDLVVP